MSGIEVAGLLLGAFPLIIAALEKYRGTAEVLDSWWNIKTKYRKCMRNLKFHKLAFEEALEELLLPLIADEDTIRDMLEDPLGELWRNPETVVRLKERMPKTYESYLETMEAMQETLQELQDTLGMRKTYFQRRVLSEGVVSRPMFCEH
jgi:hypothetical protein